MIRNIKQSDLETIVHLNQDALEGVGPLDLESLTLLIKMSDQALVVDDHGAVAGFVITLPPGAGYDSSRYRWFEQNFSDFLYLDRIVVSATHRRQGVASQLYDAIERKLHVGLEVYASNDISLAFHRSRGYEQVGELDEDGTINLMFLKQAAS